MKKVGKILLIIIVVLFALALIIPLAFKGPLIKKVKKTINENVNATVEFTDLRLNLFSNFPKVRAEIE
ncbi:MAG: hypothetical protein ABFD10_06280, partial [Prolixibacteraceae bacterium]